MNDQAESYQCDGCNAQTPGDPAAVVQNADGQWMDLCSQCYDIWELIENDVQPGWNRGETA